MAVIKYDVSDVEAGGGGVEPEPGLYPGKIVSVNHRTKKNDGTPINDLEVVVDIGSEFVRLWSYVKLPGDPSYDTSRWKLRELTDALGLPPKGGIDPKKVEGKPVMVKTKWRKDDPERAEIKNLFAPGKESASPAAAESVANAEGEDYAGWSKEDLLAEIEERGLDKPTGRVTEAKLIEVLEAADAEGEDDAEPDEDEGDGELDETSPGFYSDWSDQDLKDELADKGITVSGRFGRNKAIEALAEAAKNGGGDGDEDDPPADEYDTFTDQELKEEIADRVDEGVEIAVTGRWTRDKAIAALRADDSEGEPF
jgi:hypothetical protein